MTADEAARLDNAQAVEAIVRLVAAAHLRPESALGTVRAGELQINYFSMGLPVEAVYEGRTRAVFVKIPKEDLRRRDGGLMPLSSADRRLADEEYGSLVFLAEHWPGAEFEVSFVRPLGFHETFNAIVTERVDARDGCELFRRWDLARRAGDASSGRRLRAIMTRLGQSLRRFHDRFAEERPIDGPRLAAKLERYGKAIGAIARQQQVLERVRAAAARIAGTGLAGRDTWTLKGIDIRNVFIGAGDRVVILDPGKMKRACPEADLARFLVTYRILWWGSPLFLLGLRPDPGGEAALLEAYYDAADAGGALLRAQLVKELLKHWHTAHDSLGLKPWPEAAKRTLAATVIDPYYAGELQRELDRLERDVR